MFHEYAVYQWMKARQEKVERNARNAWMHHDPQITSKTRSQAMPALLKTETCCTSACS
ncbi:hypothetical protein LCY76_18820 [Fictibacillus sp. KIGAM418]|uniref:Uncharacterized protein n=1 Tax=Fictibacillus marinisediminis TaxID=2878389 RepID=A0A9X1XGG7_9BACL|nr:hypothetical protein [Fictibacillus marinisediminis]MCK6258630.1 hypothetical protein [Fictibacillus marinisediminis]